MKKWYILIPILNSLFAPPITEIKTPKFDKVIERLIYAESRGKYWAKSHKGAIGLMQITPIALKDYRRRTKSTFTMGMMINSNANKKVGISHLNHLLSQYDNNYVYAVNAYNMGKGNMDKGLWYEKYVKSIVPNDWEVFMRTNSVTYRGKAIIKIKWRDYVNYKYKMASTP